MGIRMLHRRKARARVHATAAATGRLRPGKGPWSRPRPARAPRAAAPRIPGTPGAALRTATVRTATVRLRGKGLARRLPPPPPMSRRVRPFVRPIVQLFVRPVAGRLVPRGDTWRIWAGAVRGRWALVSGVLGRLRRGPRTAPRITLFVAPPTPLTGPQDGSLPR
ncbi:hypothetical protein QA802_11495 [Streptomyces sp. B21-105]|uniref:hypothetical protein n=1 Tax=Streptomyces sp. B21-105 TaxID=3039417 RepID=UPI002FF1243F